MSEYFQNKEGAVNAGRVRTGKDGAFFDDLGNMLATVENWTSQGAFNNTQWQPVGDYRQREVNTSIGVSLNFTEAVVEDSANFNRILDYINNGVPVSLNFQGVVVGANGSEERYVYNQCVPSGNIDLQKVSAGEIIKRDFNFFVNGKVTPQGSLTK